MPTRQAMPSELAGLPKWALIILNRFSPRAPFSKFFALVKRVQLPVRSLPPSLPLMRALISMCGGARGFSRSSGSKRTEEEVDGATK